MLFNLFKSRKSTAARRKELIANSARKRSNIKRQLQKIHVNQLSIGMYVRKLDIPWEKSSFMFQGIQINSEDDILAVQQECQFVWVDYTENGLTKISSNKRVATISQINPPSVSIQDEDALLEAFLDAMKNSMPSVRLAQAEYRTGDVVTIRRERPFVTSRGKHFPIRTMNMKS